MLFRDGLWVVRILWKRHWWLTCSRAVLSSWQPQVNDRHVVFRIGANASAILNKMSYLTTGALVEISLFLGEISKREHGQRIFEELHCHEQIQFFDTHSLPRLRARRHVFKPTLPQVSLRATYDDDDEFLALIDPRIPDALELGMVEDLPTVIVTTRIIGFDLAITFSLCPAPSCNLFDTDVGQRVSKQQTELRLLTLNTRWRLLHSSRVKFPFVNMSASWCLVSIYSMWIFGSKLILSNNESNATLWERDTCLIIGLPVTIFLINASLSKKVNHCSWPTRLCVCGHIIDVNQFKTISFDVSLGLFVRQPIPNAPVLRKCNTLMTKSKKSRMETASMRQPAWIDATQDSVELCDTEVCLSRVQLLGTNVWLQKDA